MFIALYSMSLALAAGLAGCFAHAVLASQGYIASFQSAVFLTLGVAGLFAAVQLAFMALLNLVAPTRAGAPLLMDAISNAAAIVLLPYLLNVPIPWPHPKMQEVDLLIFAAAFGGMHVAVKLFTLFAALHSRPTFRIITLPWAAAAALAALVGLISLQIFASGLRNQRVAEPPPLADAEVDYVHASARLVQEGAVLRLPLEGHTGKPILFHLAYPQGAPATDRVFISVDIDGTLASPFNEAVDVHPSGWTAFTIGAQHIPADATHCDLIWMTEKESAWMTRTGIRPIALGAQQLLISEPRYIEPAPQKKPTKIVLIVADGIGTRHTSLAEYNRPTTSKLQAWAQRGIGYTACITPAPETASALMSILSGVSPLRHGFLNGKPGSIPPGHATLPELLGEKGYICAAFTESESTAGARVAAQDCPHGAGFERGFHLFDEAYPMTPGVQVDGKPIPGSFVPAGSLLTLERAQAFISAHKDVPFFALIRLRELSAPRILPGITPGFVEKADNPKPLDVYDSALQHFDETVGNFLDWLEKEVPVDTLCVAVAGSYGYDFVASPEEQRPVFLNEASLRVPLWIKAPGVAARSLGVPVSLEDLGPTLANLAGARSPGAGAGTDLLGSGAGKEPISVTGDPVALSLRSRRWRLTIQSGRSFATREPVEPEQIVEYISIDDYDKGLPPADQWGKETRLATTYRQRLMEYVENQRPLAAEPTAP